MSKDRKLCNNKIRGVSTNNNLYYLLSCKIATEGNFGIIVGSLWVIGDRCGSLGIIVGRCGSFHVLATTIFIWCFSISARFNR